VNPSHCGLGGIGDYARIYMKMTILAILKIP
jgi:hypothetical protein